MVAAAVDGDSVTKNVVDERLALEFRKDVGIHEIRKAGEVKFVAKKDQLFSPLSERSMSEPRL